MDRSQLEQYLNDNNIAFDPAATDAELEALVKQHKATIPSQITVTINTIRFIASRRLFLVNNTHWLQARTVQTMFSNMGLSTRTSFMKLRGCTLTADVVVAPDTTTDTNPMVLDYNGREITFKKPGKKHLGWEIAQLSSALDMQFNRSDLSFADWGEMPEAEE